MKKSKKFEKTKDSDEVAVAVVPEVVETDKKKKKKASKEEAKEPAKAAGTKRKQEESESKSDDDSSEESGTDKAPKAEKMKKGGFGSSRRDGMSESGETELLKHLQALKEIQSLEEHIKNVNECITDCLDCRGRLWTMATCKLNFPETTSSAFDMVWQIDNDMRAVAKKCDSLMKKLESEKCTLQSSHKGFVFRVLSDNNNMKMTFCLVDIYNPVYCEVCLNAPPTSGFPSTIPLDALRDMLKPCSQIEDQKDRNVAGEYVTVMKGKYMYVFDTPLRASRTTLGHFLEFKGCWDDLRAALAAVVIQIPFIPVRQVFFESTIDEVAERIYEASENIDPKNFIESLEQCRAAAKQAFDDIRSKPARSVKINHNQQLADWLQLVVSKRLFCHIRGCCILKKNSYCGVVIQSVLELEEDRGLEQQMEEDEEQQVESAEDSTLSQLLANMMAAAGKVAETAIECGTYFKTIVMYGVVCNYDSNEASLYRMTLNFVFRDTRIIEYQNNYGQPQLSSIDRMVLYAVSQLLD
uniref:Uncharacterized protein n=1 Tax=Amphimedon queenslandica TaxID=400682 RepID=A0A1X7TV07_AMPQE